MLAAGIFHFGGGTVGRAVLGEPLRIPPDPVKAHAHIDTLVDKAYGLSP